jgi:hypothetical protein
MAVRIARPSTSARQPMYACATALAVPTAFAGLSLVAVNVRMSLPPEETLVASWSSPAVPYARFVSCAARTYSSGELASASAVCSTRVGSTKEGCVPVNASARFWFEIRTRELAS